MDHRAVALEADRDAATDHLADHDPLEIADALDRAPVELDDDVAGADARGRRRAALEQLDDLQAAPAPEPFREDRPQRPRPADDAEERPADPAVVHERAHDGSGRGVDRHGQPEPDPGDRRVDPDDPAAPVGERAAGVARVERCVGLDDVLDEPARPAVACGERPPERAHDAGRHAAGEPERVADRDDELADAEPIGVAERGRGQAAAGRADDGEVRQRVAADDVEAELGAVDERRGPARRRRDDVGRRQEVAVRRERRPPTRPRRPSRRSTATRRLATDGMSRSAAVLTASE